MSAEEYSERLSSTCLRTPKSIPKGSARLVFERRKVFRKALMELALVLQIECCAHCSAGMKRVRECDHDERDSVADPEWSDSVDGVKKRAAHQGHGLVSRSASAGTLAMLPPVPPGAMDRPRSSTLGYGQDRPGTAIPSPTPSWSGGRDAYVRDYSEGKFIETKHEIADPDRTTVIPCNRPRNHPVPHGGCRPVVLLQTSAAVEALSSRARDLLAAERRPLATGGSNRTVSGSKSLGSDTGGTAASSSGTSVHRVSDQVYVQMSRALSRVLRHEGKDGQPRVPMDRFGWVRLEDAVRAAALQVRGSEGLGVEDYMEVLLKSWHPRRKAYRFEVSTMPCLGDPLGDTRTEVRTLYKRSRHGEGRQLDAVQSTCYELQAIVGDPSVL